MNCADFKHHVAAMALGALDADAQAACQAHLQAPGPHEGCAEALGRARATCAQLGLALPPVRPSEKVWHAIEKRIGYQEIRSVPRPVLIRQVMAWGLAVVLAGLLLREHTLRITNEEVARHRWVAMNKLRGFAEDASRQLEVAEQKAAVTDKALNQMAVAERAQRQCVAQVDHIRTQLSMTRDALVMLDDQSTRVVQLQRQNGSGRATLLYSDDDGRALVFASDLPATAGKPVQMWLVGGRKKQPVAAGKLVTLVDGMAIGQIERGLLTTTAPDGLALTVEGSETEMMVLDGMRDLTVRLH